MATSQVEWNQQMTYESLEDFQPHTTLTLLRKSRNALPFNDILIFCRLEQNLNYLLSVYFAIVISIVVTENVFSSYFHCEVALQGFFSLGLFVCFVLILYFFFFYTQRCYIDTQGRLPVPQTSQFYPKI